MNSVILIGRLSRDPDVRYTQSQLAVARFTVAVDRPPRRDAQGDQPTADFIDVTASARPPRSSKDFSQRADGSVFREGYRTTTTPTRTAQLYTHIRL